MTELKKSPIKLALSKVQEANDKEHQKAVDDQVRKTLLAYKAFRNEVSILEALSSDKEDLSGFEGMFL